MKRFLKNHWPAVVASLAFGVLMTIAMELVVHNWEYVRTTFK